MDVEKGIKHLSKSDKSLAKIIKEFPKPKISKSKLYFQSLIKYIIYQQLSTKSAFAIHGRFKKLFASKKINPNDIIAIPNEKLKTIGLSKQKIEYINILAKEWSSIAKKFDDIDSLDDKKIGMQLMIVTMKMKSSIKIRL